VNSCFDVYLEMWYQSKAPEFVTKSSKSLIHPFIVRNHKGLTLNPYQGCQHRCGYCYATYEWSPDFYDKIYAKNNSAELLEDQLKSWKSETIEPVMVSSATDPYQPAEIKYNLTRKCVEVLQKYDVPYYVFTKSSLISRDLELHKRYKDNCFLIWSITTCSEKTRRLIEPGTPPALSLFSVIKKFTDAGVACGVNIDPILPLITDSEEEIESIVENCERVNVKYIFGAILRLRADIWDRIELILKLLNLKSGIDEYKRTIYQFTQPIKEGYNISANKIYSDNLLKLLRQKVSERGKFFGFPDFVKTRQFKGGNISSPDRQLTLMSYI
jgi:DNA repair photolyase